MAAIDHVHIKASDPARTIGFFEHFFGARVIRRFENLGREITLMALGDRSNLSVLHVPPAVPAPEPEAASIDHIAITVDDIEALVAKLQSAGYRLPVEVTRSTSGAKIAFCLGPDNVYLELIEKPQGS
jgi:catechol 2,3-dioxygenase-like lactoylglutathione lyase family enzyme